MPANPTAKIITYLFLTTLVVCVTDIHACYATKSMTQLEKSMIGYKETLLEATAEMKKCTQEIYNTDFNEKNCLKVNYNSLTSARIQKLFINTIGTPQKIEKNCTRFEIRKALADYENETAIFYKTFFEFKNNSDLSYEILDEGSLKKKMIEHFILNAEYYKFHDPESLQIKLNKVFCRLNDNDELVFGYKGKFNMKNLLGAYTGYESFKVELLQDKTVVGFYDARAEIGICK